MRRQARQRRQHALGLFFALIVVTIIAAVASCKPTALDLGSREPTALTADSSAPEVDAAPIDAETPLTFEERLKARCNAPAGPADRYSSALELTARLAGTWYLCGDPSSSPLADPSGVELDGNGTWAIVKFDAKGEALVRSTHPDEGGNFEYFAFSDPDAGAGADGGGGSKIVARDDPTPRGGLFIYLHRGVSTIDIVVVVDFENPPRKMLVRDVGPSKRVALYVSSAGL